jgi:excisionase family DNA binding protein
MNWLKSTNKEESDEQIGKCLKPFMTVDEACLYLGISKSSMYKYMHGRKIPFFKPNNKKAYFKPEDLDSWVFRNRIESVEDVIKRIDVNLENMGSHRQFN